VKSLGSMDAEMSSSKREDGASDPFEGIADFLELPLSLSGKETPKVIRIWCKVSDVKETLADETLPLDIQGIEKIDCIEYGAGGDNPDIEKIKKETLYKKPKSNVTWSYTPLYILTGKSKKNKSSDVHEDLAGKDGNWRENRKTRFYKMRTRVLQAYEESGVWKPGSMEHLMQELEKKTEILANHWIEANTSAILVFGLPSPTGGFLWPGDIPSYRKYFKEKIYPSSSSTRKKSLPNFSAPWRCASCLQEMDGNEPHANLNKIFTFSTFDKPGFLPGASQDSGNTVSRKVWPLCRSCHAFLSRGRSYIDNHYMRNNIVAGLNLFVIPELLAPSKNLKKVDEQTTHFLKQGIKTEERLFNYLAKQGESLVFHFVFWKPNKDQEQIHLMVEDVPPTRLKRLNSKWKEATEACPFPSKDEQTNDIRSSLDFALKAVLYFYLAASKNKGEKQWLRNKALAVWGQLLGGEPVDVMEVKNLAVSRLTARFADEDWMKYSGLNTMDMARVVDFLIRNNAR
ncbi:MAG: hypothetical protein CVV55_02280, partial [Synergistetes bacterium HGW-Synergistetes-2]